MLTDIDVAVSATFAIIASTIVILNIGLYILARLIGDRSTMLSRVAMHGLRSQMMPGYAIISISAILLSFGIISYGTLPLFSTTLFVSSVVMFVYLTLCPILYKNGRKAGFTDI